MKIQLSLPFSSRHINSADTEFIAFIHQPVARPSRANAGISSSTSSKANTPFGLFPKFVNNTTKPNGKTYLPDLFPLIKPSILLEIVKHEFDPEDLYKLDSNRMRVMENENIVLATVEGKVLTKDTKGYPDLSFVLRPLTVYFEVLSAFAATSGDPYEVLSIFRDTTEYIRSLRQFSIQHEWDAVLNYHFAFHRKRRAEMACGNYSGWRWNDRQLCLSHLSDHFKAFPKKSRTQTYRTETSIGTPRALQICRKFNLGTCTLLDPCPMGRIHRCDLCGAPGHSQYSGLCIQKGGELSE